MLSTSDVSADSFGLSAGLFGAPAESFGQSSGFSDAFTGSFVAFNCLFITMCNRPGASQVRCKPSVIGLGQFSTRRRSVVRVNDGVKHAIKFSLRASC
jgi:hypothetical protein